MADREGDGPPRVFEPVRDDRSAVERGWNDEERRGTMIATSLADVRGRIESLAGPEGAFSPVCGRTGGRTVPTTGLRFETHAMARRAARETERYRTVLRRHDPRVPYYDVIVRQEPDPPLTVERASIRPPDGNERRSLGTAPGDDTRSGV